MEIIVYLRYKTNTIQRYSLGVTYWYSYVLVYLLRN